MLHKWWRPEGCWLNNQAATWCEEGIHELVPRYDKSKVTMWNSRQMYVPKLVYSVYVVLLKNILVRWNVLCFLDGPHMKYTYSMDWHSRKAWRPVGKSGREIQGDSWRMSFLQGIDLSCYADEKSLYEYGSDFSYYRRYEVYNIWNWIMINWSNQSNYWLKWYWMVHWKN